MNASRTCVSCIVVFLVVILVISGCSSITDSLILQATGSWYQSKTQAVMAEIPAEPTSGYSLSETSPHTHAPAALVKLPPAATVPYTALPDYGVTDPIADRAKAAQREQDLEELAADTSRVPAYVPESKPILRTQANSIAAARYEHARRELEPDTVGEFNRLVHWAPSFDGSTQDRRLATDYSLLVSVAVNHIDRPNFCIALAGAVYALAPGDPVAIGNLASAILSAGERRFPYTGMEKQLAPYRADARVLYEHAVACSMITSGGNAMWTLRSLTPLVNLGNLLVDLNELDQAKSVLLSAKTLDPTSWFAALGLATCYEALGRSDLAKAVLEDERLNPPASIAARKTTEKLMKETDEYVGLPIESPEALFVEGLEAMRSQEILTSADFISQLDQSERNKMRYFIEHLPIQGSYQAPEITLVSQYASLRAINNPLGQAAVQDFVEAVGVYAIRAGFSGIGRMEDSMENLGMSVSYNFDIADVMAHPEKYEDFDAEVDVQGEEQLEARLAEMEQLALQAERELATGKTTSVIALGAMVDPSIAILGLDLNRYADPMNIVMQQYNLAIHNRKANTYGAYLFSVNQRARKAVDDILINAVGKFKSIADREQQESDQLAKREAAAHDAGQNTDTAEWKLRWHALHVKYFKEYNDVSNVAWNQATSVATVNYLQKVKPQAESLYYDVIRHVALISDPEVRAQKERNLRATIDQNVYQGLETVLKAFASLEYLEEWDCGCDVKGLLQQQEAERKAIEVAENDRIARNKGEKKRFESGEIPESSPLFKKLDEYGTDLNIPFIPFMTGRISCARTVVEFKADLSSIGGPNLNYDYTQSAATGATTHRGGMEIGFNRDAGSGVSAGATLSIGGSLSMDGKGVVTDYSAAGAAKITIGAGGAAVGVGGEVTVGPQGVVSYDTSVSATGRLSTGVGGGEVTMESSIQRGNSLSAQVEANLNPMSTRIDQAMNTQADGKPEPIQVDTSMQKELWNGRFSF